MSVWEENENGTFRKVADQEDGVLYADDEDDDNGGDEE